LIRDINYYDAGGELRKAPLVRIRNLGFGPTRTPLCALVAEVPVAADVIVGLDVLRRHSFTIDYKARKLLFGTARPLASAVDFDPEHPLVVVNATVRSRSLQFVVDTGAEALCLYKNTPPIWRDRIDYSPRRIIHHLSGSSVSTIVALGAMQIGPTTWKDLPAMVVGRHNPGGWHGILAINALGLNRVHFDFQRNLLSWD
jgi:hypothetical protein